MNLAVSNTRTLKLIKRHSMAAFSFLCLTVAAGAAVFAASPERSTTAATSTTAAPPSRGYSWLRTQDDWRTIYYVVPTSEMGDQILMKEYELQNTIMQNDGELPHRTIRVFVDDSPDQHSLVSSMMAEANPETTWFVDLRYPVNQGVTSSEPPAPPLAQSGDAADREAVVELYEPFPCNAADPAAFMVELLAGLCN